MFNRLCSIENLYEAFCNARSNKRGRDTVACFEYRLEEYLFDLQQGLLRKTYAPGHYHSFYIHEPKRRLISASPFRDRVVHHALCKLLEPLFEPSFIFDTYANRVGKGTHKALSRAQSFARRYRYVLQCDVKKFFPSIDHQVLLYEISRKICDLDVLWLVKIILDGGKGVLDEEYSMTFFPGDDLLATFRPRGQPIGNLTSQFWANVYLNPFDHCVKRELGCKGYVRYVDDFLLFANSKRELWFYHQEIIKRLQQFRLEIHKGTHPRPVTEGFPFLGFHLSPNSRRLKRRKGIHYQRKLRRMAEDYADGKLQLSEVDAKVRGWINHVRYGNTVGLRKKLLRCTVFRRNNASYQKVNIRESEPYDRHR
ncbi:reverse transcriptase domain-containing protein [Desulfosediminicola flagellatus]|uniref:reverse transcriptase domain-containing protein n=1 Tax=Desulfosediminicola flagellatus TaxID=2569541 RepID=UPI0010ACED0B|nr:reverse transcriptase domain-containing protein [Desulfosediminicola flagellatus]